MGEQNRTIDLKVRTDNLYREGVITDLRVATIRELTPVKADGSVDEARPRIYIGQTHVMTAAGPVPIEAPLDADTLAEALEKFPKAIQAAIEQMVAEVRELQRQEASRIIVPKTMPPGKIQLG